jgi:hypothetical protein
MVIFLGKQVPFDNILSVDTPLEGESEELFRTTYTFIFIQSSWLLEMTRQNKDQNPQIKTRTMIQFKST